MSQFHACDARNFYPGTVIFSVNSRILKQCEKDIMLDYKEADLHNFQILDIFRGRTPNLFSAFRKLKSDKNSRVVVIITSHGGENFIKVRGKMVILSDELDRTLNEMYIKQRYKELIFIVDTCEGYSLYEYVNVPNILFVTSSKVGQKAHSYSFDENLMTPTSDKFHFLLYDNLTTIYNNKNFDEDVMDLFKDISSRSEFLSTEVGMDNKIKEKLTVGDVFGNPLIPNHKNEHIYLNFDNKVSDKINNILELSSLLNQIKLKEDEQVFEIKKFYSTSYQLKTNKNKTNGLIVQFFCALLLILATTKIIIS